VLKSDYIWRRIRRTTGLAAITLMAGVAGMAIPTNAAASVSATPHQALRAHRTTTPHRLRPRPHGASPHIAC
jgi:hypothetical protein